MNLKIVAGGQTGVDRGALDAALEQGMSLGGFCPKGRKAEDGVIDLKYPLIEHESAEYIDRTRANVLESDATLIVYFGQMTGGTLATYEFCQEHAKAHLCVDALAQTVEAVALRLLKFIEANHILVLNVAGPRASGQPSAYTYSKALICHLYNLLSLEKELYKNPTKEVFRKFVNISYTKLIDDRIFEKMELRSVADIYSLLLAKINFIHENQSLFADSDIIVYIHCFYMLGTKFRKHLGEILEESIANSTIVFEYGTDISNKFGVDAAVLHVNPQPDVNKRKQAVNEFTNGELLKNIKQKYDINKLYFATYSKQVEDFAHKLGFKERVNLNLEQVDALQDSYNGYKRYIANFKAFKSENIISAAGLPIVYVLDI